MREERFTGKAPAMEAVEYRVWNRALAEFFYGPAFANQPVYLQVDTDTLREVGFRIGIESDQAEQSFVAAVRSKLYLRKANPFGGFLGDTEDWRKRVKADPKLSPPFLGLLGACVLAASRMASDPALEIRQSNYYIRLNEILGLDHRVMPPCFEKVTNFWRELNRWLRERNNGALGSPTAQYHARFSNIGYPISQCLLSKVDRSKLTDFFLWEELSPEDDITVEELIPSLKGWVTRTRCKLTERGKALFNSDNGSSLIRQAAKVVAAELKSWDGRSMDAEGRLHAKIELSVEISHGGHQLQCTLFPQAPESFPEGVYEAGAKNVHLNYLEEDLPWFEPLPDEFLDEALAYGLVLRRKGYVLRFTSAPVIPLTADNELGDWMSCNRVTVGEKHLVLCHQDYGERVEKYLTEHAKPGWEQTPGSRGLPSGWLCFRNVQVTTTSSDGVPEDLECLVPRLRVGIRLAGGLKMGRGVWFKGGEPKALITTQEDKPMIVQVDGEKVEVLLKGSGEVNLGRLDLESGEHEVSAGGQRRRFDLRGSHSLMSGSRKREILGHILHRKDDTFVPASLSQSTVPQDEQLGRLSVVGARLLGSPQDIPAPLVEALTLPPGYKRYVILGSRPGEVVEHDSKVEVPHWFLKPSSSQQERFELPMPFEPQWLIGIGTKRRKSLRRIGLQPPETTIADERRVADWVRWARKRYRIKGKHKHLMWEQYRKVAKALQVENEGDEL